jgi:transposase-like protein
MNIRPIPTLDELAFIFASEQACIDFLAQYEVFYKEMNCPKCGREMNFLAASRRFRCPNKSCKAECSYRKYTIFFDGSIECRHILRLGYLWLAETPPAVVQRLTGHSNKTISAFFGHFRRMVAGMVDDVDEQIGGEGITVELDESKLGKRKYNRGHRVEGVWVLGGVERTQQRRIFMKAVPDRSAETLLGYIERHVLPGSTIITDLWKGYSRLPELGFHHLTVNHSKNFKDAETGAHTNTIEGTWNGLKLKIAPRNRTRDGMDEMLLEFIWRRIHSTKLWEEFIRAMRDTHYDCE